MPGDTYPYNHSTSFNLNFDLCASVDMWYSDSKESHSPLIGFMLDGIPIYGPKVTDAFSWVVFTASRFLHHCTSHDDEFL